VERSAGRDTVAPGAQATTATVRTANQALAFDEHRRALEPSLWQQSAAAEDQVLKLVRFAGDHGDVGGGHPDTGLSDIALL
jgi:hypothetical protein